MLNGFKQQLMGLLLLLVVGSFVFHLIGLWVAPEAPALVIVALLVIAARLVFWWRRW